MSNKHEFFEWNNESELYEIRLKGHLDDRWSGWFEGLTVTREEDGDTLITGPVIDQAALHGLLKKVRDLGMPLVSVSPLKPSPLDSAQPTAPDIKSSIGVDGLFTPNQSHKGE